MSDHRLRNGVSFTSLVTYWLFLAPLVWSSQQQERQTRSEARIFRDDSKRALEKQRSSVIGVDLSHESYKRVKDTHIENDNPSALQTLAPAHRSVDGVAVRASSPAPGSGRHRPADISSLRLARSLQDWEVEDLILLATVDGSLYARDRKTGMHKWGPILADFPVVETIYHRENTTYDIQGHSDDPLDDFLWIVEPVEDGEIYLYNRAQHGVLQKLHMTVKNLQERTPHASEDPPVVYVADKSTTLFSFDVATGEWLKAFGSGGPMRNDKTVCRREGFEGLGGYGGQECGLLGLLTLGRVTYNIHIKHRDSSEPICTIKYSEWVPNLRDSDLRAQHKASLDESYVISRHDGSVLSLRNRKAGGMQPSWQQKLPSPVIRVFDVTRPANSDSRNTELVILPQPIKPANFSSALDDKVDLNDVFVNHTAKGGWYALSEQNYPLVTSRVARAQCYDSLWVEGLDQADRLSSADLQKVLVGVHPLAGVSDPERNGPPQPRLGGPTATGVVPPEITEITDPLSLPHDGYYVSKAVVNLFGAVSLLIVALLTYILCFVERSAVIAAVRKYFALNLKPLALQTVDLQGAVTARSTVPDETEVLEAPGQRTLDRHASTIATEGLELTETTNGTPIQSAPPDIITIQQQVLDQDGNRISEPRVIPLTTDLSQRTQIEVQNKKQAHLDIVEPDAVEDNETEGHGEGERKKARRGTRGGKAHRKKNKNRTEAKVEVEESAESVVGKALEMKIGEPARVGLSTDIPLPRASNPTRFNDTTLQIGQLTIFKDKTLGHGSHGTQVFRGSFGGRDVAVKAMLKQLYDIASHEVTVLQESDDHRNVVRYHTMESDSDFMYIALELCPASLADVIERPHNYIELLGPLGLDAQDALRQITLGIRHLHSLKIVHRDIKPENILIATPKRLVRRPGHTQPTRLLISDFGLCKKLEIDQSSFRATTAHAAGTSGWRAPELLVDDENDELSGQEGVVPGTQYSTNSEPVVVDAATNRRVTRAIDIFALGCVFYYVLSKGNHPFDGKGRGEGRYMREANIIRGNHMLEDLSVLGAYQGEAHDLISQMLAKNPKERPDASVVLAHPFFWSPADRLDFLCHVSDQFEFEPRDPPSAELGILESVAPDVIHEHNRADFLRKLPSDFVATLGKQRKYKGDHMLDLLRALRNKRNHYEDMPDSVKAKVGSLPEGYLIFWTERFPKLLMKCHQVVKNCGWERKDRFRKYYEVA